MSTGNLIPGAATLGNGINIFGTYGLNSLTSELFQPSGETYPWSYGDKTYQIPRNVLLHSTSGGGGRTMAFESQEAFQTYFANKTGLTATGLTHVGAFTGQFAAAYEQSIKSGKQYYWCLSEQDWTFYRLTITDRSEGRLNPTFLRDMNALPTGFDAGSQRQFFNFFEKYGTHFVDQVVVGGHLYYYQAVLAAYSASIQEVKTKASLEFKAVFFKSKAEAEADWKSLGATWEKSRNVSIEAVGGKPSILEGLSPTYGSSYDNLFKEWVAGIESQPAVVDFRVEPIYKLVSLDAGASSSLYDAMREALGAYMTGLQVETRVSSVQQTKFSDGAGIHLNRKLVPPSPDTPPPAGSVPGGYQLVVFDRATREPFLSRVYYFKNGAGVGQPYPTDGSEVYVRMQEDISAVDSSGPADYVVALAGFGVPAELFPPSSIARWLARNGIDMGRWQQMIRQSGNNWSVSLAGMGRKGHKTGVFRLINWRLVGPSTGDGRPMSAAERPALPFYLIGQPI